MKNCLPTTVVGAAATGLAVALYTLLIEHNVSYTPGYRPLCDISSASNCSVVRLSSHDLTRLVGAW